MPSKLVDLSVSAVANVDRPANQRKYLIVKRADDPGGGDRITWINRIKKLLKIHGDYDNPVSFNTALANSQMDEQWWKVHDALRSSIRSIVESDVPDKATLVRDSLVAFMDTVVDMLGMMDEPERLMLQKIEEPMSEFQGVADDLETDVAKAGKVISDANMKRIQAAMTALEQILGSAVKPEPTTKKEGDPKVSEPTKSLDDILKGIEDETTRNAINAAHNAAVAKAAEDAKKAAAPAPEPEPVKKEELPENVRKHVEGLEERLTKAEAESKASNDRLAKIEEERAVSRFDTMAAQYPYVPGESAAKANILRKAYDVSNEHGEAVEAQWKAINLQMEQSDLFKARGLDGGADEGSDEAKIEAVAKKYAADNSVNYEKAYNEVTKPGGQAYDIYKSHLDATRQGRVS